MSNTGTDPNACHHGKAIENLKLLQELGEIKWLDFMSSKWTCVCGSKMSWYYKSCGCKKNKNEQMNSDL